MTADKQGALAALLILAATALISAGLIVVLRPWLQRCPHVDTTCSC